MYAADRVLVGVVKRKRDFRCLREENTYRIPCERWHEEGIEYLGFFLSGKLRSSLQLTKGQGKSKPGAICYFAAVQGYELVYRHQLLPDEKEHPRANAIYYCLKLGFLRELERPIVNETGHRFSFIRTDWERFIQARRISDLFARAPLTYAGRD